MEGHIAMEWKDPNPGLESSMGFQTRGVRPDTIGGHSNEDVKAGFEKHGLSVAISSPQEEGRSLPLTPQFGQKTSPGSSLAERMQARAGFKVPKLNMPFSTAAGADNSVPGAPSPYLTIPPGLSPATLLESPVFVSNAMVCAVLKVMIVCERVPELLLLSPMDTKLAVQECLLY
jgi:WRKY transcription factor 2